MSKANLQNAGYTARQADAINGFVDPNNLTAAGTNLATAAVLPNDINRFTVGGALTGVVLGWATVNSGKDEANISDVKGIINRTGAVFTVYAPTGATLDGAASLSIAINTSVWIKKVGALDYTVL